MTIAKRLTRIETSLLPLEAVLLWLTEVLPLDIDTFQERLTKCPAHEHPLVKIPEMVAKAVRESVNKQMMTPAAASNAEFQARRQAAFLVMLVINLHIAALSASGFGRWITAVDCLHRLLLQVQEQGQSPPLVKELAGILQFAAEVNKNCLNDLTALDVLGRMLLLRETTAAISNQYFVRHRVLIAGAERLLNERIQELQSLALAGKESQPQSSAALDLAALESSTKLHVPQTVEALVVKTEAEVLERLGQWEAAWKLRQQHATAVAERLISSMCQSRED